MKARMPEPVVPSCIITALSVFMANMGDSYNRRFPLMQRVAFVTFNDPPSRYQ